MQLLPVALLAALLAAGRAGECAPRFALLLSPLLARFATALLGVGPDPAGLPGVILPSEGGVLLAADKRRIPALLKAAAW